MTTPTPDPSRDSRLVPVVLGWTCAGIVVSIVSVIPLLHQGVNGVALASVAALHCVGMGLGFLSIGSALRESDFFHPSVVARTTFVVLYLASLPLLAFNPAALAEVGVNADDPQANLWRALLVEAVVLTGLCAMLGGEKLVRPARSRRPIPEGAPVTGRFLWAGFAVIGVGMWANANICGGWGAYFAKMARFFERSENWEAFSAEGGFLVSQLIRWLPMGVIVVAWGCAQVWRLGPIGATVLLLVASGCNLLLSSATGGRGIGLTTLFYSIILFNAAIRRFKLRTLILVAAVLISLAFTQGIARGIVRTEGVVTVESFEGRLTESRLRTFWLSYLTNDLRLLQVIEAVDLHGYAGGRTLLDPVLSLIEGRPARTTGIDLDERVPNVRRTAASRFGVLADAYYNLGFAGVAAVMCVIGMTVGALSRLYTRADPQNSVQGAVTVCWAAFTANFVVAGNVHALPKYFLLASLPVYGFLLLLGDRRG
jgi:hypothetical protein